MEIIDSAPEGRARLSRADPVPASTLRILRRLITEGNVEAYDGR